MPEWIQSEGIDEVIANLRRAGATAVATSPYVMAPNDAADAGREPPIDAGSGKVRLLDRLLWGRRELRCITAPSFRPDRQLYRHLSYQPAAYTDLSEAQGKIISEFLLSAKQAGLEVQLQVQAAIPPGYRVQFGGPKANDQPRLPDGHVLEGRVDKNGSLASAQILGYGEALLKDISIAYPMADAIRIDWPEYPPYSLKSWFFDFNAQFAQAAQARNIDIEAIRADCLKLLKNPQMFIERGLMPLDGFALLQELKAQAALNMIERYRATLPSNMKLIAHAFPDPWCQLSGMDMEKVGGIADEIAVKLYTMHWPMMLRDYLDEIIESGCDSDPDLIAQRLQELFDTGNVTRDLLRYPEPDEPHPVDQASQIRKIEKAIASGANVMPAAHSYGPLHDVLARIETAFHAGQGRVWINRYGYLSDDKLDALGSMVARWYQAQQ